MMNCGLQNVMQSFSAKKKESSKSSLGEMPIEPLENCIDFPVEEVANITLPGYGLPKRLMFSGDDTCLAYLFSADQSFKHKLFVYDLENKIEDLFFSLPDGQDETTWSAEEKLRRLRLHEIGQGVTWYEWVNSCPGKKSIMVSLPTGIYLQELSGQPELKVSCDSSSPIIDPRLSPDCSMLAYVRGNELHSFNLSNNEAKQLTSGADGITITHGIAEYVAQEDMTRKNGYWWSLDSKFIAFMQVDSSPVPRYRIMHQGKNSVGPDAQEDVAYPFVGASNAKVRLGVVSASGGSVTWMDLLCGENSDDEYLGNVNWMHGNILTAQILNRSQTKLRIAKFDIETGQRKVILVEENDIWISLHECFRPVDKGLNNFPGGFLWASEKTGFRHLYLHDIDGVCLGSVTQGEWMVEAVVGVNEASGIVYFTATFDGPMESHLYCAKLFPDPNCPLQEPEKLTQGKGQHFVLLDHGTQRFVDTFDSMTQPPKRSLCSLNDGSSIMSLFEQVPSLARAEKLQLEPPEICEIQAKDGSTLYGALYKPDVETYGPPPYKSLVEVYGGPNWQWVHDTWFNTVDMRAQFLRSKGILVWKMDNRGTPRRGLKFEGALKYNFGNVDSEDQVTGVEWLISQGLAKEGHIGMWGFSYGGYLSALMLAKFPELFCFAVSAAPVTHYDGYNTFYTEKYMGLISENPSGYEKNSVLHNVGTIKGKLLLIHGLIDENVHFRHTARLVNALVAAGKPYELLIFPDERHMPLQSQNRIYMEERIWEFIQRNL